MAVPIGRDHHHRTRLLGFACHREILEKRRPGPRRDDGSVGQDGSDLGLEDEPVTVLVAARRAPNCCHTLSVGASAGLASVLAGQFEELYWLNSDRKVEVVLEVGRLQQRRAVVFEQDRLEIRTRGEDRGGIAGGAATDNGDIVGRHVVG